MHTRSHTRQSAGPRGRPSAGPRRRSGNRPRITFRRENPNSGYVEKQRGPHGDAAGQKRTGGPRSIWAPRRVREVGAQFPDRQGRVSPSQALSKPQCPEQFWLGTANGPHHRGLTYQLPLRPWIRIRSAITGRGTGEELLSRAHGSGRLGLVAQRLVGVSA